METGHDAPDAPPGEFETVLRHAFFMGTFIHALDARTGKVVWTSDGDAFNAQPHGAYSSAGVARRDRWRSSATSC